MTAGGGVRQFAGLGEMTTRGLLQVTGSDAKRWLDGMVTNEVAGLTPGDERSGCYALLLTHQGRIVADLHVLLRTDGFWLETARDAVATVAAHLERYIIADDVALTDVSDAVAHLGLEGPHARALVERVTGAPVALAPHCIGEAEIAGAPVRLAAFGFTGEDALQLFSAPEAAAAVADALRAAAAPETLEPLTPDRLEVLRIEAAVALPGSELDETVLPDEAGLADAVSTTKGCYTGQEVVARLRSRGKVKHRLVALRFDAETPPPPETALLADGRRTGEVTSTCRSPAEGAIGLGFVGADHAAPGSELAYEGGRARVAEPVVPRGSPAGADG